MRVLKYILVLAVAFSAVPAWAAEGDDPVRIADDDSSVEFKGTVKTEWPVPIDICISTPPDTCP